MVKADKENRKAETGVRKGINAIRLAHWLRDAPRWTFLAALVYAPWHYGGTTTASIVILDCILGSALVLWLAGLLFGAQEKSRVSGSRYGFPVPRAFLVTSAALLILGWWMVLNATFVYDADYLVFISLRTLCPGMPGSVDRAISAALMLRVTMLIGSACLVADLSQNPRWLLRLWWAIALAGGSIALLGLLQKATGASTIFWGSVERPVMTFFATFYYHANAGAFLNLVLPPSVGLAGRAFTRRTSPVVKAASLSLALLVMAAVAANTSRMAQLIGALLILLLLLGFARAAVRKRYSIDHKALLLGYVVVALTLSAIARASHLDQSVQRWSALGDQLPADARWLATRAALGAVGDAGWFGFGPGTFRIIFPYYTGGSGQAIQGIWRFLHQDYLQTILEWGWIGSSLWAVLFFGGIALALRNSRRSKELRWSPRFTLLLPLIILALGGIALHGVVDFPFQIASLQLYAATYLGLCWGSSGWGASETDIGYIAPATDSPRRPA